MPFRPVVFKPGPKRIAAALQLAGFSQSFIYPAETDDCGVTWDKPSALLLALSVIAGESSGNAWAYHINQDSYDFGMAEINNIYNSEWFGPIKTPLQLNWAIYYDNAQMMFEMWQKARALRISKYGRNKNMDQDWLPWHAYSGGGYKTERYAGKSWMSWSQHGIDQMNAALKTGASLDIIAAVDDDPLVYWT